MRHREVASDSSSLRGERSRRVAAEKQSQEKTPPDSPMRRWLHPSRVVRRCAWLHALLLCVYVCIPFVVKSFPAIQAKIVFQNSGRPLPLLVLDSLLVGLPLGNLSRPSEFNLSSSRAFFVPSTDGVLLGAWYIPAHGFSSADFPSSRPIVLYLHGNTGHRGGSHRVELYRVASLHGFDVVAFDYRGYGDSSNVSPSEDGVVADAVSVFEWISARSTSAIHMWGHSLGSGIATKTARLLSERGTPPRSLVLEAPFNNLREAARAHPLAKLYGLFPCFDWFFVSPLEASGLRFTSDEHVVHVKAPVTLLHAKDDWIIPYSLGVKLYESARGRPASSGPVKLLLVDGEHGHGHKYLVRSAELSQLLRELASASRAGGGEE